MVRSNQGSALLLVSIFRLLYLQGCGPSQSYWFCGTVWGGAWVYEASFAVGWRHVLLLEVSRLEPLHSGLVVSLSQTAYFPMFYV